MKKLFLAALLSLSSCFGTDSVGSEVDCLVIKEENSIICKYMTQRSTEDKFIKVEWINPEGEISRTRNVLIPSGHGSVYDFRYLSGREVGVWNFRVTDKDQVFNTTFEVLAEE
ncbi:hypothetical protein LXN10_02925 [Arcobacter sp. KX21116]|jgi:hypothetical protein|uniref:hypothetical protein n=1 Tax=Arcobacter iocasae TaxID=2906515 RepID=UPI0035D46FE7|tara:strand:+ start:24312 stop:24650 length:339 start_codon:yes stop_codon:yes gene_type:complete